ncbi:MAG: hypothetical protein LBV42_04730 [Methanobrevibacter sp.]|jgi:hypothetical protein|nr:hypothetical protein [Methanobrevibacter sp.]
MSVDEKLDIILKSQIDISDRLDKIENNDLAHINNNLELVNNNLYWIKALIIGMFIGIVVLMLGALT